MHDPAHVAPRIRAACADGLATLTLASPGTHNALAPGLLLDLCVAIATQAERPDLRCVLVQAEGGDFSQGPALAPTPARPAGRTSPGAALPDALAADPAARAAEVCGLLNQAILALLRLPQPVVVAAQGCVGGGALGLLLAGDVVVLADDAVLDPGYARSGLSPHGGWTALLPARIGAGRAAQALLLDRPVPAALAREWGLVAECVPAQALAVRAQALARRIADAPPASMRHGKALVRGDLAAIEAALDDERLRLIQTVGARRSAADAVG